MSEQKKAKDISDLKARLGLKGGTAPASSSVPPPAVGSIPTPVATGTPRPPTGAVVPPPMIPPPMVGAPGMGLPGLGGAPVPPPPFARPAAPVGPDLSRDPFAVHAPVASPREVRLVIDERVTVSDAETGRGKWLPRFITVGIALLTLGVGYCTGNTMLRRQIYNRSVADGVEIKGIVESSAKLLAGAQVRVAQAVSLANTKRTADFETATHLRGLKKPIDANAFHRRNYIGFAEGTVDNLFDYYNGVNRLWDLFQMHAARTTADREALTKAPRLAETLATTNYGVVLSMDSGIFLGNLVILGEPRMDGDNVVGYPAQARQGSPSMDKIVYRGAELTSENFGEVVMPLNPASRAGLLAENLSPFREYLLRLNAMNVLLNELTLTQRQLLQQLSEIAQLEPVAATGEYDPAQH